MLWASSKAFAAKVPQQSMWMMNGCSTPSSTFPSATNSALTSQSIQLSHPTVLILLGNDLEDREWKTLVEEAAVPGGLQLPGCVCTMRNCFILNCFANAFLHVAFLARAKSYCKHNVTLVFHNFRWNAHSEPTERCFYSLTTAQRTVLNCNPSWIKSIFCSAVWQLEKGLGGCNENDPPDDTHRNILPHPQAVPRNTSCFPETPNWALSSSPPRTSVPASWVCMVLPWSPSHRLTHRNDVILAEAQLIVIMALKVQ